jgi:hypothetical protein
MIKYVIKVFQYGHWKKYIKDSYDLHVFYPMFLSPYEPLVFHEDEEIVEDLVEAPCDPIEDHAHEKQDDEKGT